MNIFNLDELMKTKSDDEIKALLNGELEARRLKKEEEDKVESAIKAKRYRAAAALLDYFNAIGCGDGVTEKDVYNSLLSTEEEAKRWDRLMKSLF